MSLRSVGNGYTQHGVGNAIVRITTQTGTAYTLASADNDTLVTLTNAAAISLTVPTDASVVLPVGSRVDIVQGGAGQVTVVAPSGVTVNSSAGLKLRAQWSGATLIKTAANTWILMGDITT